MTQPKNAWPVTVYNDMGKRTVVEDFVVDVDQAGIVAKVPKGFRHFDGASIPKILWTAIGHPFTKAYERAALVHDYLYKTPGARGRPPYAGMPTRREIDKLFFMMLVQDGVRHGRAKTMWRAVKNFGDKKGRFWTEVVGKELSLEDEIEIAKEIKLDALELLSMRNNPLGVSFSPTSSSDGDAGVDEELLDSLAEINWDAIDPELMEL